MFFSSVHLVLILVYIDVSICVRKVFVHIWGASKDFLEQPNIEPLVHLALIPRSPHLVAAVLINQLSDFGTLPQLQVHLLAR